MSLVQRLFTKTYRKAWQTFCREIEATYVKEMMGADKILAQMGEWTITIDTFVMDDESAGITYTRFRAPYISKDGIKFEIYRKNFLNKFREIFGIRHIEAGVPILDDLFVIYGNNVEKIRRLFSNPKIYKNIVTEPGIYLAAKDYDEIAAGSFPKNADELYLKVAGIVDEVERLKDLYHLFTDVLKQLVTMGSASQENPDVVLE